MLDAADRGTEFRTAADLGAAEPRPEPDGEPGTDANGSPRSRCQPRFTNRPVPRLVGRVSAPPRR